MDRYQVFSLRFFLISIFLLLPFNAFAEKLLPPENGKIYLGANPGLGGNEDVVTTEFINNFDNASHPQKPAMWTYFSNNWTFEETATYPETNIQTIIDAGKIPFVRLMPFGGITERGAWDGLTYDICGVVNNVSYITWNTYAEAKQSYNDNCANVQFSDFFSSGESNYSLYNIAHDEGIETELREWAQAAKAHYAETNTPLLVDFAVEMNGYWFIWGGEHQDPEDYKNAYKKIIDIFREEGVEHITWFFHADIAETPYAYEVDLEHPFKTSVYDPANYYPGNDYIDWIGFSLYGTNDIYSDEWKLFSALIASESNFSANKTKFEHLALMAPDKPMAVLEFAVTDNHQGDTGAKKAAWLEDAIETIKNIEDSAGQKRIKGITYWNAQWENAYMNIDPSPTSISGNKFRELMQDSTFVSTPLFGQNHSITALSPKGNTSNPVSFKWEAKAGTAIYSLTYARNDEPYTSVSLVPDNIDCGGNVGICTYYLSDSLTEGSGYYWRVDSYNSDWSNLLGESDTLTFEIDSNTTYENAEDETTSGWVIYDNNPSFTSVTNVFDAEKSSRVISLQGSGTKNGYRLGHHAGKSGAWNNTSQKVISWDSKFSEHFNIYITVDTLLGQRYLIYRPTNSNLGIRGQNGNYIYFGLGTSYKDGQWHSTIRDLQADLQVFEAGNQILSVNGFLVRGSGSLDNISLLSNQPVSILEDAQDGTTTGWGIYDQNPTGASVNNIYDPDSGSQVISLEGSGTNNGYRLGNHAKRVGSWNNTSQKILSWDLKFSENFSFYVTVDTPLGRRYLLYRPINSDLGIRGSNTNNINLGLGTDTRNGQWHSISRDLEADLKVFEPDNHIISVNGVLVRGSGRLDKIKLQN